MNNRVGQVWSAKPGDHHEVRLILSSEPYPDVEGSTLHVTLTLDGAKPGTLSLWSEIDGVPWEDKFPIMTRIA